MVNIVRNSGCRLWEQRSRGAGEGQQGSKGLWEGPCTPTPCAHRHCIAHSLFCCLCVLQVTYMISRKRSEFGAPVTFSDQNASSVKDAYIECTSYPEKNYTLSQVEKDVGLQVIAEVKDTSTQTKWYEMIYSRHRQACIWFGKTWLYPVMLFLKSWWIRYYYMLKAMK